MKGQSASELIGTYETIDSQIEKATASYVIVNITDSEGRVLNVVKLTHESFNENVVVPIKDAIKDDLKSIHEMNIKENIKIAKLLNSRV